MAKRLLVTLSVDVERYGRLFVPRPNDATAENAFNRRLDELTAEELMSCVVDAVMGGNDLLETSEVEDVEVVER